MKDQQTQVKEINQPPKQAPSLTTETQTGNQR